MGNGGISMASNPGATKPNDSGNSSSSSSGNGNSKQKRGAERLFQYLEADDSDPEDYTR